MISNWKEKYVLQKFKKYGKIFKDKKLTPKSVDKNPLREEQTMTKTKIVTRTAVILALAIIFQNLRYLIGGLPYSNIIIGSLVNLTIIVATGSVGIISGIVVCLVTPVVALYQGQLPHVFLMPVTMLGNTALAASFYLFVNSRFAQPFNYIFGVVTGAIIKWVVMYWLGVEVVLKMFVPNLPPQRAQVIAAAFNTPQIFTALIGGILGIFVIKALKRNSVD